MREKDLIKRSIYGNWLQKKGTIKKNTIKCNNVCNATSNLFNDSIYYNKILRFVVNIVISIFFSKILSTSPHKQLHSSGPLVERS